MSNSKAKSSKGTYSFSFPSGYTIADVMEAFTAQNGKTVNDLKMAYFVHQDKLRIVHCLKGFKLNPDTLKAEEKLSYVYINDERDGKGWDGEYVGRYEDFGVGLHHLMHDAISLGPQVSDGPTLGAMLKVQTCNVEFEQSKSSPSYLFVRKSSC